MAWLSHSCRLRQTQPAPERSGQFHSLFWTQPGVDRENRLQKRGIIFEASDQIVPVHILAPSVNEIQNVSPITVVPLKDIKFAPNEFFHRNYIQFFTTYGHVTSPLEPGVINLRAPVGHGPNYIDDDPRLYAAVNPFSIIGLSIIIIHEAGPAQGRRRPVAIPG